MKLIYKHFYYITLLLWFCGVYQGVAQENQQPKGILITTIPNKNYKAGLVKRILLGTHYRKEWTTPIQVKVFKADTAFGGLTPIKQGGSRQTTNLHLKDSIGRQYVIRSINKTPTRVLEDEFQKTVIAKILQDQASSENPYGQLVIPPLARAAKVFYTNPRLIYIPYDSSLGKFAPTFANMLAFIEERPDEDMSHLASSGNSKNVVSTRKMFEKKFKDNDNIVDYRLFARTRLFDMLIGDWGRHEDQWRWATYDYGKGTLFKPIPRDRDHVFYKADGVIPYIGSQKWAVRNNENFTYKYNDIVGLNMSAKSLDRPLLAALTKQDWLDIADSLKAELTDQVIEDAVKHMPENIYPLHGSEITAKLKSRRDKLGKAAVKYYKLLAKDIDVVGSSKKETFIVNRLNGHNTEVTVLNSDSDTIFHRLIFGKETREIRLYGLGGDDVYNISGRHSRHSQVRVIKDDHAKELNDSINNASFFNQYSYVSGNLGNQLMNNTKIIFMRADAENNEPPAYDRSDYNYNLTTIRPSFQYNVDDGIFLGVGLLRKSFGFRKYPYAAYHSGTINYSTRTQAFSISYFGDFKKVAGKWNLMLDALIFGPKYALNYFGMGNETQIAADTSIDYYRIKAHNFRFAPLFYKNLNPKMIFGIGPQFQYVEIEDTPGRFISTPQAETTPADFDRNNYLGVKIFYQYNTLDNNIFPKRGIRFNTQITYFKEISKTQQFVNIAPDISFFYTPSFLKFTTFATRIGGGTNLGSFKFFQSNTLGGTTNLRGYRRTRYYGRSSFYQNTEARIKLADVNFYLFPGKIGLILFFDYGRVWADNEKSHELHYGYGPGLYLQIHNRLAFTGTYGLSTDKSYFNLQLGFLF